MMQVPKNPSQPSPASPRIPGELPLLLICVHMLHASCLWTNCEHRRTQCARPQLLSQATLCISSGA